MKTQDIYSDLFTILKNKTEVEREKVIHDILNKTYIFEFDYLNNLPNKVILNCLKEMIEIITKEKIHNINEYIIQDFNKKISKIEYKKFKREQVKYYLNIIMENSKLSQQVIKKTASVILAISILAYLGGKAVKSYANENQENNGIIELDEDNSKTFASVVAMMLTQQEELKEVEETEELLAEPNEVLFDNFKTIDKDIQVEASNEPTNELSIDEKIAFILKEYNITLEQFNTIKAIVMAEAQANSYNDGYAVINTMYNRTISKKWLYTAEYCYYDDDGNRLKLDGTNIYDVAISPNQFVVYQKGYYKEFLDVNEGPVYDAIIDFLMTKETMHDYAYFLSYDTEVTREHELFDTRGNRYFGKILEEDRIDNQSKER